MNQEEITYSFPLGPTYQDQDGDKVLIIALPNDCRVSKFVGICNGELCAYDSDELFPYIEKPDPVLSVKESVLREVLLNLGFKINTIDTVISAINNS